MSADTLAASATSPSIAVRFALRELRGGFRGFRIFIACLALGVAAIAGAGSLNQAVQAGIEADAQPLLGGDLRPPRRGLHSLDPMFGLTWAPGPQAKTVLRLGGGVYHDDLDFFMPYLERGPLGPSGNGRVVVDGSVAGISFLSGPTAFRGADLLPLLPGIREAVGSRLGDGSDPSARGIEVVKQGDFIFAPGHSTPYALHLTAGLQRELSPNLVLSLDFVFRRQ